MANQIIPKKSVVSGRVPTTADLGLGEISINHADRIIYSRRPDTGAVQSIAASPVHTHVLTDITDLGDLELVADWNEVINKPATFPAEAHTHPLSDISQSAATTGQVPAWNGAAWVPQTLANGGYGVEKVITDTTPINYIRMITQAEYDAISPKDENTLYFIKP